MKRICLFFFLFFPLLTSSLFGQVDSLAEDSLVLKELNAQSLDDKKSLSPKAKRLVARGDNFMVKGPVFYEKALTSYLEALETNTDNSFLNLKTGLCYLQIKRLKSNSILYLEKAFNQNKKVDKKIHQYLGQAYQLNSNPSKAIKEYKIFLAEVKKGAKNYPPGVADDLIAKTEKRIAECEFAVTAKKNRNKTTKIINLGDSVNSAYPDYQPFITPDEKILIFTSRRPSGKRSGKAEVDGEYYEDIYVTYFDSAGYWTKAKVLDNMFNKKTNDAIVGLAYDATRMLVYRDTEGGDIYFSEFIEGQWSRPRKLKNINSAYHEPSGTFSADLKDLYFVSNKPGGQGGHDIYRSKLIGVNEWGEPENLGPVINSSADEISVFMHPNGRVLYFSSNGENSIGGYDIFKSNLGEDGKWSKPENLGMPVNTPDDDISFTMSASGEHGYFASYNNSVFGSTDIQIVNFNAKDTLQTLSHEDSLVAGIFIPQLKSIKKMYADSLALQLQKDSILKVEQQTLALKREAEIKDSIAAVQMKQGMTQAGINDSLASQQGIFSSSSQNNVADNMAYVPLTRELLNRLSDSELMLSKIDLKDNTITSSVDPADAERKKQEISNMQNKLLSPLALSTDRNIQLSENSTDLLARFNKKELEQLLQNADVDNIYISTVVPAVATAMGLVGQDQASGGANNNAGNTSQQQGGVTVVGDGLQYVALTANMLDFVDDNQPIVSKVYLKDNEITSSTDPAKVDQKVQEINNLQNRVLSSLPKSTNRDLDLSVNAPEMSGSLTKEELKILLKNSDVKTIMVSTPFATVLSNRANTQTSSSDGTSSSASAQNNIIVKDGIGYMPLTKEMLERMRDGEIVTVRVDVKDNELSSSADPAKADQKKQEIASLQNKVLLSLPSSADRTISSSGSSADFSVGLTKQEIEKLLQDPNVHNVLVSVSYANILASNNGTSASSNALSSTDGTYSVQLKNGQTALVVQADIGDASVGLTPITKDVLSQLTDTEMKQITVMLKNNNYTEPTFTSDIAKKTEEIRNKQTTVINPLNKQDLTNVVLFDLTNGFAASANKKAITQLLNDPLVDKIYFGQPDIVAESTMAKNNSSVQQAGNNNMGVAGNTSTGNSLGGNNLQPVSSSAINNNKQLSLNEIMQMRDGDRLSVAVEVKENRSSAAGAQAQQNPTNINNATDIANTRSMVAATISSDTKNSIKLTEQPSVFTGDLSKKDLLALLQNNNVRSITRIGDVVSLASNNTSGTNDQNANNISNTQQSGKQGAGVNNAVVAGNVGVNNSVQGQQNAGSINNNGQVSLNLNDIIQMNDDDRLNVLVEVKNNSATTAGMSNETSLQNTRTAVASGLSGDAKNNVKNVSGSSSSFTASLTKKELLALLQRNDVNAIYNVDKTLLALNATAANKNGSSNSNAANNVSGSSSNTNGSANSNTSAGNNNVNQSSGTVAGNMSGQNTSGSGVTNRGTSASGSTTTNGNNNANQSSGTVTGNTSGQNASGSGVNNNESSASGSTTTGGNNNSNQSSGTVTGNTSGQNASGSGVNNNGTFVSGSSTIAGNNNTANSKTETSGSTTNVTSANVKNATDTKNNIKSGSVNSIDDASSADIIEQSVSDKGVVSSSASSSTSPATANASMVIDGKEVYVITILFGFGGDKLDSVARFELDKVAASLSGNPNVVLALSGHADSKGSESFNFVLSRKRAEAVKLYLIKKGIKSRQLVVRAYGEVKPVSPNENPDGSDFPEGRMLNRRVEIRVK